VKVVIHTTPGGFELSRKAVDMLVELGYTKKGFDPYGEPNQSNEADFRGGGPWTSQDIFYITNYYDKALRSDPRFVGVIESLGKEAEGFPHELDIVKVVDIPFDTLEGWTIKDDDGAEWIEELPRTWR